MTWLYFSKSVTGAVLLLAMMTPQILAASPESITPVNEIIELNPASESAKGPKYRLSAPKSILASPKDSRIDAPESTQALLPEDAENLKTLWQAVIDKNVVIQYGLKQLATPPELRYAHTSVMSRAVGGLLTGASLVPFMMGADQVTAGASTIGANLVDRAMVNSQKIDPTQLPSDTELVELSGLVQALQQNLARHYLAYKQCLMSYLELQQLAAKYQRQVAKAQETADPFDDFWARQLAENANNQMLSTKNEAKRHYLVLERLVGHEEMARLRFGDVPVDTVDTAKPMPRAAGALEGNSQPMEAPIQ